MGGRPCRGEGIGDGIDDWVEHLEQRLVLVDVGHRREDFGMDRADHRLNDQDVLVMLHSKGDPVNFDHLAKDLATPIDDEFDQATMTDENLGCNSYLVVEYRILDAVENCLDAFDEGLRQNLLVAGVVARCIVHKSKIRGSLDGRTFLGLRHNLSHSRKYHYACQSDAHNRDILQQPAIH